MSICTSMHPRSGIVKCAWISIAIMISGLIAVNGESIPVDATIPSTTSSLAQFDMHSCVAHPDGIYADPFDCHRYYHCVRQKTFYFRCFEGFVFDPCRHRCVFQKACITSEVCAGKTGESKGSTVTKNFAGGDQLVDVQINKEKSEASRNVSRLVLDRLGKNETSSEIGADQIRDDHHEPTGAPGHNSTVGPENELDGANSTSKHNVSNPEINENATSTPAEARNHTVEPAGNSNHTVESREHEVNENNATVQPHGTVSNVTTGHVIGTNGTEPSDQNVTESHPPGNESTEVLGHNTTVSEGHNVTETHLNKTTGHPTHATTVSDHGIENTTTPIHENATEHEGPGAGPAGYGNEENPTESSDHGGPTSTPQHHNATSNPEIEHEGIAEVHVNATTVIHNVTTAVPGHESSTPPGPIGYGPPETTVGNSVLDDEKQATSATHKGQTYLVRVIFNRHNIVDATKNGSIEIEDKDHLITPGPWHPTKGANHNTSDSSADSENPVNTTEINTDRNGDVPESIANLTRQSNDTAEGHENGNDTVKSHENTGSTSDHPNSTSEQLEMENDTIHGNSTEEIESTTRANITEIESHEKEGTTAVGSSLDTHENETNQSNRTQCNPQTSSPNPLEENSTLDHGEKKEDSVPSPKNQKKLLETLKSEFSPPLNFRFVAGQTIASRLGDLIGELNVTTVCRTPHLTPASTACQCPTSNTTSVPIDDQLRSENLTKSLTSQDLKRHCRSLTCFNGAMFIELSNGQCGCLCPNGWRGDQCQHLIDHSSCHCANGGRCVPVENGTFACLCPFGYLGGQCQYRLPTASVDESNFQLCDLEQQSETKCQNGGVCLRPSIDQREQCYCPPGYAGEFCQQKI